MKKDDLPKWNFIDFVEKETLSNMGIVRSKMRKTCSEEEDVGGTWLLYFYVFLEN